MSADDQIVEKRKHKLVTIVFLVYALFNFAFGIDAFIAYHHISSKLVHVGDKLNQTGVDALIRMEKDFTIVALCISIILIGNSIVMIWFFSKTKSKNNL